MNFFIAAICLFAVISVSIAEGDFLTQNQILSSFSSSFCNSQAVPLHVGTPKNIAIIGAGPGGLISAKEALQIGCNITVYERNEDLGGVWRYTDETGKNKYGVDIHSAMYKNLRTNIPIQLMASSSFPIPSEVKSYPLHTEVLKYFESFADHFDLRRHIKFCHNVIRVAPIENEKWEINVNDLVNNVSETKIYDAVLVANGHFSVPDIPNIPGASEFNGTILHSRDFRDAEKYRGDQILIIGSGSSGTDLVAHCLNTADRITWSQRKVPIKVMEAAYRHSGLISPKVTLQESVKRFTETGAEFSDGSHQTFSVVIFATGYQYKFPFLSDECDIRVEDNFIEPLYKNIINIKHPTMAFIGITSLHEITMVAKFALKFISGEKTLPSMRDMFHDMRIQYEILSYIGIPKNRMHGLHSPKLYQDYLKQLSDAADIEEYPKLTASIHEDSISTLIRDPSGFRKYNYIIGDETFTKEKCEE